MTLGEMENYAKQLKIRNFRGVFMRDNLPEKCHKIECGIVNLDSIFSTGSHWTCYFKNKNNKIYFDSYGNARPPRELVKYLGANDLQFNTDSFQNYEDPPICGHLCLEVLRRLSCGQDWHKITLIINKNKYVFEQWF